VTQRAGNRDFTRMRWGLVPSWWPKPLKELKAATFNARVETVAEKPFFREAFRRTRCIIPASGYCEWQNTSFWRAAGAQCRASTSGPEHDPSRRVPSKGGRKSAAIQAVDHSSRQTTMAWTYGALVEDTWNSGRRSRRLNAVTDAKPRLDRDFEFVIGEAVSHRGFAPDIQAVQTAETESEALAGGRGGGNWRLRARLHLCEGAARQRSSAMPRRAAVPCGTSSAWGNPRRGDTFKTTYWNREDFKWPNRSMP